MKNRKYDSCLGEKEINVNQVWDGKDIRMSRPEF